LGGFLIPLLTSTLSGVAGHMLIFPKLLEKRDKQVISCSEDTEKERSQFQ
jgi:hypothetical protein